VLLLTGLAAKRQGWRDQFAVFGQMYRTIIMDNRDAGDSDLATSRYRIADMAEDTAAVLRALNVTTAHIVGISMGGFISLELVLRHPDLVQSLTLTSTSAGGKTHVPASRSVQFALFRPRIGRPDPTKSAMRTYTLIMAPGYAKTHPVDMAFIGEVARYHPQSGAAYRRQLRACLHHDAASRLGQIAKPTLVVHGTVDPLVPVGNGHYLAGHIAGARLVEYPATGHIPIVERATDYNRDVLGFLGGL
jgi:pimeloyl-ACP methyl ester carboxylesterase